MSSHVPGPGIPRFDVVVVGGGITGAAAAWYLSSRKTDVLLVDKNDLNTDASGRNAGSLHGQIQHAPFLDRGERWASEFAPALDLLHRSLQLWDGLGQAIGADLEVKTNGGLLIAETDAQMREVERKARLEMSLGFDVEILSRDDLNRIAPYVSDQMVGAELCPAEGKANPLLATPALALAAAQQGAAIWPGVEVVGLELSTTDIRLLTTAGPIDCDRVVCASGGGLRGFGDTLGVSVPLIDEPVQVSATESVAPYIDHLLYFAGDKLTLKQAQSGTVLIGGGWPSRVDPNTGDLVVDPDSLRRNLSVAQRVVPGVGPLNRTWPGMGIATPDLMPIIGALGDPRVLIGIYPHMGFTAGPLMGQILAMLAMDEDPVVDITPFSLQRF
jgi:glycine/D-amino acid oxidase-like deaminating enzyme